jgi:hypothetical protein
VACWACGDAMRKHASVQRVWRVEFWCCHPQMRRHCGPLRICFDGAYMYVVRCPATCNEFQTCAQSRGCQLTHPARTKRAPSVLTSQEHNTTVSIPMCGSATSGRGADETGTGRDLVMLMWGGGEVAKTTGPTTGPPRQEAWPASGCFSYTAASDATARVHGQQFCIYHPVAIRLTLSAIPAPQRWRWEHTRRGGGG